MPTTRILVADDDPISLTLVRTILQRDGATRVITARDGSEAWARLEAGPNFALCIFDIHMPGLGGLALTEKLRSDPRFADQRVMLCSSATDRETVEAAAALAVYHFVVKPFSRDALLQRVRDAC